MSFEVSVLSNFLERSKFITGQFLLGNPKYFGMQIDDQDWDFNNPRMGYNYFFLC